jgi:hypothetical protein
MPLDVFFESGELNIMDLVIRVFHRNKVKNADPVGLNERLD